MKQFRADVDDDLYRRIRVTKAELEAETNAELLDRLIEEADTDV